MLKRTSDQADGLFDGEARKGIRYSWGITLVLIALPLLSLNIVSLSVFSFLYPPSIFLCFPFLLDSNGRSG